MGDLKTNVELIIYFDTSTNPENLVKISPVVSEITQVNY